MERVNIVVVASLAAALLLAALRLFSPTDVPSPVARSAAASGTAALRDRDLPPGAQGGWSRRSGDGSGGEAGGDVPPPGDEAGGDGAPRRYRSRSGGADVIAGSAGRGRTATGRQGRGPTYTGVLPGSAGADGMIGSRVGAVSPARSGSDVPPAQADASNGRHTLEFVDEPKPDAPDQSGAPEVLFSLPLRGDVKPEVGEGAIQADGLVSQGGEIEFPEDAQLSVPVGDNIRGDAGTISFDFKPQWMGNDESNNSLLAIRDEHVWENSLAIVKNYDALRFIIHDSQGVERNVNLPIGDWPEGESRQIVAAWNGESMSLYVNGQLAGTVPLDNPIVFKPTTPMYIGSDYRDSPYLSAGGAMSHFKVFGDALTPDQIG